MVFTILSAILHLTNIRFSHDDETDGVYIDDEYPLEVGRWDVRKKDSETLVRSLALERLLLFL